MPIYEYKCNDCGKINDVLVRNTQNIPLVTCSACKSENMERLVSAPGAVMAKNSVPHHHHHQDMPCPNQHKCGMAGVTCPGAR